MSASQQDTAPFPFMLVYHTYAVCMPCVACLLQQDGLPGWLQLDVDQEDNTAFGMWGHAAATGGSGGGDQVQPVPGPWDKLSISKKLLSVIGSELAACESAALCMAVQKTSTCLMAVGRGSGWCTCQPNV